MNFQPILGLIIGLILFAILGYVHWYGTNKKDTFSSDKKTPSPQVNKKKPSTSNR